MTILRERSPRLSTFCGYHWRPRSLPRRCGRCRLLRHRGASRSKGFRLLAVEPLLRRPERFPRLIPLDLCGQFLRFSAGQDFADELEVLQGNDRGEVLTVAPDK